MPLCDYVAGWVSGVVALIIGHPFDTIKIQQQIRAISFQEAAARIKRHKGWTGFYRGIFVPIFTTGSLNAIFFGVYGDIRDYLVKNRASRKWAIEDELNSFATPLNDQQRKMFFGKGKLGLEAFETQHKHHPNPNKSKSNQATFAELFVAGAAAGVTTLALASPGEVVKTKLQAHMKRQIFTGPVHCFFTVLKEAGIRGIYRGIMPMAIRNSIGSAVQVLVLCKILKTCNQRDIEKNAYKQLWVYGVAGTAAWTVVLPFDTIKSRMQADNHRKPHYRNMVHCAKEILKTDGKIGFFRGFWSCLARAVPVNAIIFVVYELIEEEVCENL